MKDGGIDFADPEKCGMPTKLEITLSTKILCFF